MRFLDRTKDAHVVTYDTVTNEPVFAHWFGGGPAPSGFVESWESRTRVLWMDDPTPEMRVKEERVRVRFLLSNVAES